MNFVNENYHMLTIAMHKDNKKALDKVNHEIVVKKYLCMASRGNIKVNVICF